MLNDYNQQEPTRIQQEINLTIHKYIIELKIMMLNDYHQQEFNKNLQKIILIIHTYII